MFENFEHFCLSVLKLNVGNQGWNSKLLVRKANREDPDTASEEAPNVRISTVHAVLYPNIPDGVCS